MKKLLIVFSLTMFLISPFASCEEVMDDAPISEDSMQTVERFGWSSLDPVNWGRSLEHDAEKIGKDVAKTAEKSLKVLESLLDPCKACKIGLRAGINSFLCKSTASQVMKQVEECAAKVSEAEPELAPESPEVCSALKTGVEIACKRALKKGEDLTSFDEKIVNSTCASAHLCK